MITISLSDFINFTAKSGTTRLSHIREIKNRKPYLKRVDYWHEARESIFDFHADSALTKDYFDVVTKTPRFLKADSAKLNNCIDRLQKYKTFLGRKQITVNKLVKCDWRYSKDLTVRINPELHATINDETYLLKLYFKDDLLDKRRTDIALYLIKKATQELDLNIDYYALLELYRPKLWKQAEPNDSLEPLLIGDAEAIIAMYKNMK
ncbi:MAG: hypothetical protein JWM96_1390 [Alphaproteobacteria bacterium]|nr:hypothetical protein [Alphaproteobacteria bacterium]